MNNYILTSLIISIIYFVCKFVEMRFILKENKPLKNLVMDTLLVFLSSVVTFILLEQFNLNQIIGNVKDIPNVFVNKPDF